MSSRSEPPPLPRSPWSDDARLMIDPFRVYAELAAAEARRTEPEARRSAALKALLLLGVLGAFVSFTSAGRLVAFHVVSTMVFWSFVPVIQLAVFAAVRGLLAPSFPLGRGLSLYFNGHGPWLLFLMALALVCFVAPDVYATLIWLLGYGVLPGLVLVVSLWAGLLTFACFRSGMGLSRARSGAATALFYLGYVGTIVGYYLATNQIQPQLRGWPT